MKVIVHLKSGTKLDTFVPMLDSAGSEAACHHLESELRGNGYAPNHILILGDLVLVREEVAALEAIYKERNGHERI